MDAFEGTVQKAKEVFDTAVKKTGDFVSVSKQKLTLSSLHSKLTKAYAELGRLQYREIKDKEIEEPTVSAVLFEIKHILSEIKVLKEEIDNAEGKVTCPKCGEKSPAKSAFCNRCGADLNCVSNSDE